MTPFFSDNALTLPSELFCFLVRSVFLAERTIFVEFNAVGRVLLVFVRPVIAPFAFGAGQGYVRPHVETS